ncbi:MAG: 30S ribosomal protein S6 [Chloroflexi bacterium]|nr:30S ribosomal protein S6 [Chloroflexota bacterium]
MRRYELMLVLRPDLADDRVQATLDRATRSITGSGGQIVKVGPWGRRRLAYPIGQHREGSYFIVIFDAPSEALAELERGLNITEEAMRHLVTRIERPVGGRRASAAAGEGLDTDADQDAELAAPPSDEEPEPDLEFIDESESEAAPAAIE